MEDSKELLAKLNKVYGKDKISYKDDTALMNKVISLGLKLADDPANNDIKVFTHKDIVELLKNEKKRACWSCHRFNCLLRQNCSQKLKMNKRFFGECTGKQQTFKELKE